MEIIAVAEYVAAWFVSSLLGQMQQPSADAHVFLQAIPGVEGINCCSEAFPHPSLIVARFLFDAQGG